MDDNSNNQVLLHDFRPAQGSFRADVVQGLKKPQKVLPCKYFYDERGSSLFETICSLNEYYIPRIETAIMQDAMGQIAELLGPDVLLIEYGSGSSTKTHILIEQLRDLAIYMPVDISRELGIRRL